MARNFIDLRSDTVTQPTESMLEAMARAPLGDDVLGDDPTVQELEVTVAKLLGKETAVYVPSGTMSNQIALAARCDRGDVVIFEEEAHMLYYEVGGPAVIAGVQTRTLPSDRGTVRPENVEKAIMKRSLHTPGTSLICLENTHNRAGGAVINHYVTTQIRALADAHGIGMHLDGARLFNACAASGASAADLAKPFETVSVCFSKGIGAPVGSALCGSHAVIERARIWRKRLGGAMRQSGLLAACALTGLKEVLPKLPEDHRRARELGAALAAIVGCRVNLSELETNFVMVETDGAAATWVEELAKHGVRCMAVGLHRIRLVLHHQITDEDLPKIADAFREASGALLI